jgi:hypothetical protein
MLADAQRGCYVHQQMRNHKSRSNAQACGAQVASEASTLAQPQFQQIKLALDVHAASIVAVRMIDGAKPQPPQTFKPADFLAWAKKQVTLAQEVISCYETGLGQWLPGFLRSHQLSTYSLQTPACSLPCPEKTRKTTETS